MPKAIKTDLQKKASQRKRKIIIRYCSILILVLVCIGIIILVAKDVRTGRAIQARGVTAIAVVTARDTEAGGRYSPPSYYLDYEFSYGRGSEQLTAHHKEVYRFEWEYYPVGKKILIAYIPNDPDRNLPVFSVNRLSPSLGRLTYPATLALLFVPMFNILGQLKLRRYSRAGKVVYLTGSALCLLIAFFAYPTELHVLNTFLFAR